MASLPGVEAVGASGFAAATAAVTDSASAVATANGMDGFAASMTGAVDELRALQSTSSELAVAAVTGDLDDIHSAMIASTRAAVTLELVAAVRNKGVEAFTEIMRMQA